MGGKSTSHSAVLSDKRGNSQGDFDLRSWQGLTEVLKTAKESLRDPHAYSEFRDLVLHYAQQGGDAEIRKKIDAVISQFPKGGGVTIPVVAHEKKDETPKENHVKQEERKVEVVPAPEKKLEPVASIPKANNFAVPTRRIVPQFQKPAVSTPAPSPVPQIPHEEKKEDKVKEVNGAAREAGLGHVEDREGAMGQRVPEPMKVVVPVSPPPVPPTPTPVTPTPKDKVNDEVREGGFGQEIPVTQGVKTLPEYKNRIIEIKRAINGHVGNPAALIDTPNDLGKKYMSALLTALKATGGGGGNVDGAMQTLENAYRELMAYVPGTEMHTEKAEPKVVVPPTPVVQAVKESEPPVPLTPKVVEPGPEVEEEEETEEVEEIQEKKPEFIIPQRERKPVAPFYNTAPTPETEKRSASRTLASLLQEDLRENVVEQKAPTRAEIPVAKPVVPPPAPKYDKVNEVVREGGLGQIPVSAPVDTSEGFQPNKYTNKGVGSHSPVLHESGINPSQVAVKQSELSSPEITQALYQLLNEWTVFKSSGLFGIGPSGPDHPMYLTLAPLSMGEVVAGRWEGSDMKTVKVLKQYIDAWRHEQGIAYTINETFEHYLRRVVQRILKRQQG